MSIAFHIPCVPPKSTHQQNVRIFRRGSKPFIGKSKTNKAAQAEASLIALLKPHAPLAAMQGALRLSVRWTYPYRKSEPKKNRLADLPCTTRPDCDNLTKGLQDIMSTLGFWNDDAQVAQLHFSKWWGEAPGIQVTVTQLTT